MAYKLQLKRGLLASLPNGSVGEPLFTTDTFDLYVGKGDGTNVKLQKFIASGSSSQFLKGDGSLDSTTYQGVLSGSGIVKSTGGTISYLTDNSANWDAAYNDKINSASVTGTTTKTLTLNQQDGGTITASWSDYDTAPVTSVFGRTGAVVAASGDFTTSLVTEGTNLYFTDARARAAITLTTTGSSGSATYVGGTLNIPTYTLAGLGGVPTSRSLTINGTSYDLSADRSWSVGTVTSVDLSVPTGFAITGNPITSSGTLALAFATGYSLPTNASQTNWDAAYNDKINSASVTGTTTKTLTLTQQDGGTITASWTDINTDAVTSVFGRTGAVVAASGDYTTTQVTEGTNLYYTEARVSANTDVAANTAARHNAVTLGTANGLSLVGQALSLGTSSSTTTGALSSTDWTTFNSKQAALNGTGFVKISGTTISYDNSTYYLASNPSNYITLSNLSGSSPINYNNTTGQITIQLANGSQNGYLSSTDWTTFNNKQSALTNPVTGTGTTNYIPKFTGSTTIGDSVVQESSANIGIGGTPSRKLHSYGTIRSSNGANTIYTELQYDGVYATATDLYLLAPSTKAIVYYANNAEQMRLTSTGLGIGTTSPARLLDVNGEAIVRGFLTTTDAIKLGGNTSAPTSTDSFIYRPADNTLAFGTASTERLRIDVSGNLGLGVTPSAWSAFTALQLGGNTYSAIGSSNNYLIVSANTYYDGTNFRYVANGEASRYQQSNGSHQWHTAASGTAGNAISFTQAMTLDASGNLGLGNTSPSTFNQRVNAPHIVVGGGSNAAGLTLYSGTTNQSSINFAIGTTTTQQYDGGLVYVPNSGSPYMSFHVANGTERFRISSTGAATFSSSITANTSFNGYQSGTHNLLIDWSASSQVTTLTNTELFFGTNAQRRMTITNGGNVGIGTSSPSAKVEITGIQDSVSGKNLMLKFDATYYAEYTEKSIRAYNNEFIIGTGSGGAERMRITSGGNLLVGTTVNNNSYKVGIEAASGGSLIWFSRSSASVQMFMSTGSDFYITTNNSQGVYLAVGAQSWSAYSDLRLKNITNNITNALLDIDKINPIRYTLKNDESQRQRIGLIAQEVQEIAPEVVDVDEKGFLSIRYTELIPLLIQSIKELKAEIEQLKNK